MAPIKDYPEEDRAFVERLQAGDKEALSLLYDRYAPLLLGLGIKMLRNREEAEDVLHDVFMEAWAKAKSYDPERGSVRAWLTLRMRSRVVDKIRSAPKRREVATDMHDEASRPRLVAPPPEPPKLSKERNRVRDALSTLAPEQRRAVELVYFEAKSVAEAAQLLSCPEGTVKSRLFSARRQLRAALPGGLDGESDQEGGGAS